ncbi:MAG: carbamoyl phosphate synthase large subunit [Deltaproteobacteria bacterium]|nr:carbamoyl phosphate synthase large subunit [Deltaproteobacteria bacterium]
MFMKKVLVLGSGALKIGEAGEFDYSGSQALKALKEEGIQTVLLNPNIATIQTSLTLADEVYLLPVTPYFVEEVIKKEKPDGILLSFGGQTALNCGLELWKDDIFTKYNVEVLGTPVETILDTEDRERFTQRLEEAQATYAHSIAASNVEQAQKAALEIGYPVMVRIAYALGGLGSGVCRNEEELRYLVEQAFSHTSQILLEEYLEGWKEIEYEVVRDRFDNCITVCNMENFDPMGIHTGESIVVAPSQTLSNQDYHLLREVSIRVIRHLGVIGECNIQFAYHPKKEQYRIIEVNARLSRSSALASKATGYPLAFVAAKLALGYALHQVPNKVTLITSAMFEPALDYVVVKIPRWDLQKFSQVSTRIGSGMKSVGEIMAIGTSFEEAIQKGLRMLQHGYLGLVGNSYSSSVDLQKSLLQATDKRIFDIVAAFENNHDIEWVRSHTHIDPWFLHAIKRVVDLSRTLVTVSTIDKEFLYTLKNAGFSDQQIALYRGVEPHEIRELRKKCNVYPCLRQIDTLAGEFPAQTNYLYLSYRSTQSDIQPTKKDSVLVLGSGSYRIGSSVEFDWCSVTATHAIRKLGYSTIMLNYNPETVSTDYDESDILIFDEVSLESVLNIQYLLSPSSVLISVGGQISNNLAIPLCQENISVLGTSPKNIDIAESREQFSELLDQLQIDQPKWSELRTMEEAKVFARRVGYPVLVRPSYVLSGAAMTVVSHPDQLEPYLQKASDISPDHPVVISNFITGAREIEFDGVASKGSMRSFALSEHIENAGVHSGDATMVLPPQNIAEHIEVRIIEIADKIACALSIHGPYNIQFLVKDNNVKVIECNLRSSRSFPFVSKVLAHNFIEEAMHIMLGQPFPSVESSKPRGYIGVKAPQFSFARLRGADPCLGVEMSSTGEVGCLGETFPEALLKSMLSVGYPSSISSVLISAGPQEDKHKLLDASRKLVESGIRIYATPGSAAYLQKNKIDCISLPWPTEKQEKNVLHIIEDRKVDLVINIPKNYRKKELGNGYKIRRSSVDFNIPLITNAQLAHHYCLSICDLQLADLEITSLSQYSTRTD